jgi:hypothetical protein
VAWLLVTVTGLLAVLVVALALVVLRMRGRIEALEARPEPAETPAAPRPAPVRETPEFVITRMGEPEVEPVPTVPAPVFADIVARESVVQAASLMAGLRRALDPEVRNRIRFHVRQEVRRSRKQRKAEQRDIRREWAARQREQARGDSAA